MALAGRRFYSRLFIIYFLDWLVIIATIGFASSTSIWVTPNTRPFSANDLSISFPFQTNSKVPSWLLILWSIIIPGLAIAFLTLAMPSGTESYRHSFRSGANWKRRLYCLNTALLGLGLSYATALLITNGLKNLLGRPRPDLISRCNIDTDRIEEFRIGPGSSLLDWGVCRNRAISGAAHVLNEGDVRDGFRSFPSGHASLSFAGLAYFAIFLAEFVFALPLPHLSRATAPISAPIIDGETASPPSPRVEEAVPPLPRPAAREERETPLPRFPIMAAILIVGIPIMIAMYISSTRFSDYRHHPFDILAGAALGIGAAWLGWRWYGAWTCAVHAEGKVYMFLHKTKGNDDEKCDGTGMAEKGAATGRPAREV